MTVIGSNRDAGDAALVAEALRLEAAGKSQRQKRTEYDLAEAASYAWNAFYQGRPLTQCKTLGGPIRLLGTPFLGE
jgi:hypothetical protein